MIDFLASSIPAAGWIFLVLLVLVGGGIMFYALHSKGDFFAELTHGATSFKLHAKERPQRQKRKP